MLGDHVTIGAGPPGQWGPILDPRPPAVLFSWLGLVGSFLIRKAGFMRERGAGGSLVLFKDSMFLSV